MRRREWDAMYEGTRTDRRKSSTPRLILERSPKSSCIIRTSTVSSLCRLRISSIAASPFSWDRQAIYTLAPWAARTRAVSLPRNAPSKLSEVFNQAIGVQNWQTYASVTACNEKDLSIWIRHIVTREVRLWGPDILKHSWECVHFDCLTEELVGKVFVEGGWGSTGKSQWWNRTESWKYWPIVYCRAAGGSFYELKMNTAREQPRSPFVVTTSRIVRSGQAQFCWEQFNELNESGTVIRDSDQNDCSVTWSALLLRKLVWNERTMRHGCHVKTIRLAPALRGVGRISFVFIYSSKTFNGTCTQKFDCFFLL